MTEHLDDSPLMIQPPTYTVPIPTYDKALVIKKSKRTQAELEALAAKNIAFLKAGVGSKMDVKWIQSGVGLVGEDVDGDLGPTTSAFILEWQKRSRFEPTGVLDLEQIQHFPLPNDTIPDPIHQVPLFARTRASSTNKPYDHAYFAEGGAGWPVIDNQWEAATSTGSWLAAMLRLLTGRGVNSKGQPYYDREPDDFITLDTYSIGFPHFWADTAPEKLLRPLVERFPYLAVGAWGEDGVLTLLDPEATKAITGTATGARRYNPRTLAWLAAGWSHIARHPEVLAFQVEVWVREYVLEALAICREFALPLAGREGGLILAAVARMCNTGPATCRAALRKYWRKGTDSTAAVGVLRDIYGIDRKAGGYSKNGNGPRRWDVLERTCRVAIPKALLDGDIEGFVSGSLNLAAPVERSKGLA